MKTKNLKMLIALLVILLTMLVFNANTVNATGEVNIKDSNLKAELLTYDTDKDGELSQNEMNSITNLSLDGKGITDLTGLEYATNLETLSLSNYEIEMDAVPNNITDISALSNLTKLSELWLNHNNVTDISALSKLTKLEILYLPNNNISDISALSSLINLKELSLANNNIESILSLSKLNKLETLYLSNNYIADFTPISNLNISDLNTDGQKTKNIDVADKNTGIILNTNSAVIPTNTKLVVKAISEETTTIVKESLKDMAKYTAYDITLLSDNKTVQPNGKVTIKFAIPSDYDKTRLTIYRIEEDGTKTQYDTKIDGNYAIFETDHFSTYVLAEKKAITNTDTKKPTTETEPKGEKDDTPKTGTTDIISYVLITTAIAGIGIVAFKKKLK